MRSGSNLWPVAALHPSLLSTPHCHNPIKTKIKSIKYIHHWVSVINLAIMCISPVPSLYSVDWLYSVQNLKWIRTQANLKTSEYDDTKPSLMVTEPSITAWTRPQSREAHFRLGVPSCGTNRNVCFSVCRKENREAAEDVRWKCLVLQSPWFALQHVICEQAGLHSCLAAMVSWPSTNTFNS